VLCGRLGNIWSPGFDPVGRKQATGLFGEPGEGHPLEDKCGSLGSAGDEDASARGVPILDTPGILDTRGIPTFTPQVPSTCGEVAPGGSK